MSLTDALNPAHIRALAGYAFARGEQYFRQGRVVTCELEDDELRGVVAGADDYDVCLFLENGDELWSACSCPVGGRGGFCKHAVALALRFLHRGALPVDEGAQRGRAFATKKQLEAWAAEHGVTHELDLDGDVIAPELPDDVPVARESLSYILGRWTLRELGSLDTVRRCLSIPPLRRPVAEAVASRLERAAADVRAAIAEESAPREPPDEPTLLQLWTKLLALRARVRTKTTPRSRAARARGELTFERRDPKLVWKEPAMIAPVLQRFSRFDVEACLHVIPDWKLTCACQADACTHGLALIDAALDLVGDKARIAEARTLAEELLRPPWERALAELAKTAERSAKPKSEIEVWWLVERELGALTLTALVKKRLKRGGLSSGTRTHALRLLDEHGAALSEPDLTVAQHLAAWHPRRGSTYPARAFAALVGHPRVAFEDEPEVAISVERKPLGFTALPVGSDIRIEPSVDGARFSPRLLAPLLQVFAPGEPLVVVEPEHGRCRLVDVGDDARRVWSVLDKYGDTFPVESHDRLVEGLAALDRALPIVVPEALLGDRLDEPPTVVVRMRLTYEGALEVEPFVRPAAGAPLYPPGAGPRDVLVVRDGIRHYARRDLDGERALAAGLLARLPLESAVEEPVGCFQISDVDAALAMVAAVQDPPDGLEAEWIDRRPHLVRSGGPGTLSVRVDQKRDWFGITGNLKIEKGRVELAVLLDAARQQRRFVRLDDGRWLELSKQIREQLAPIADQTFVTRGDQLELSPGAVAAMRALQVLGAKVETAPAWQVLGDRLAAAERLRPKPPAALAATLRPYQVEGHAWLARLAAWGTGACLADDMGLGKTIQAIALLLDRAKLGPAIVLAPTSVTLNWVDELRRFAPTLRPVVYADAPDRAACIAALGKRDVLVVSYGLLVRDLEHLTSRSYGTLVLDEAQAIKNHHTQRAKAARMIDAGFRVALSGTPLENHVGELWSLFSIVFPGLLGSWEQFRSRFAVPIERDKDPRARAALSRLIRPFLLRRTKAEVARELPARTEIQVPVALSSDEQALYEDARLAALAHLAMKQKQRDVPDPQHRFQVLAAITRLRLLASHPKLYDPESPVASSKMQRLCELVDELRSEGHRALVFSQFTSHLTLARESLAAAGVTALYLDGGTPARERAALVRRFQAGEGDVFLISLKAGGTGINLTAADYVIHLDPWWNPAVEDQATDRAHRIGQTKPVTVFRLVSRGTVEEKILAMHGDKRALVADILDGTDVAGRLTTKDLLALVGELPVPSRRPRGSIARA